MINWKSYIDIAKTHLPDQDDIQRHNASLGVTFGIWGLYNPGWFF